MHVVVLGAGLAGLSAARELAMRGCLVTVLERQGSVGGRARSWRRDGHWLDLGPRPFRAVDDEQFATVNRMLPCALVEHEPRARVQLAGASLHARPKVIELARLSAPTAFRAAWQLGLARARAWFGAPAPSDLEEWSTRQHGRALHELVTAPLALGTTGLDASLLEAPADDARRATLGFHYPASGGIGVIARAIARDVEARGVDLRPCAAFTRIEHGRDGLPRVTWERDGVERVLTCDAVVSTLPITELARGLAPSPSAAAERASSELAYVSMLHVYVEVAADRVLDGHWVDLPEAHLRVRRVSESKQLAPLDAPKGRTVLCCEIPCRQDDAWWRMDARTASRVATEDLAIAGILPRGRARPMDFARVRFAEPVRTLDAAEHARALTAEIERDGTVVTTGRQGRFGRADLGATMAEATLAARALVERLGRKSVRAYSTTGGAR